MKRFRPTGTYFLLTVTGLMLLQGCLCHRKTEEVPVARLPIITEALYDTSSVCYLDRKAFPKDMNRLPIGILSGKVQDISLLETFLQADNFDNITGAEEPDGIRDFAGEYFDFGCFPNPSLLDSLQTHTVKGALYLLNADNGKLPSKILVLTDYYAAAVASARVHELLSDAALHIKVVSSLQSGIDKVRASLPEDDKKRVNGIGILSSKEALNYGAFNSLKGNQNYVVSQAFNANAHPSLTHADFPINPDLIDAYHFLYGPQHIDYTGSRYNPKSMTLLSEENLLRYFLTQLLEKMRAKANSPALSYLILGDNMLSSHKEEISDILNVLRDYRRDGRYVYRHLISNNLMLVDPAQETARNVYRLMLKDRLPAYRSTENLIWLYPPYLQIDPQLYPLTYVCINHR